MLEDLKLPSLQSRMRDLRLPQMYKMVNGLVPGLPPERFLQPKKPGRRIRASTRLAGYSAINVVDRSVTNNSKPFHVPDSKTLQFKNSFFIRTIIDWNHLDDRTVSAVSPEAFSTALRRNLAI